MHGCPIKNNLYIYKPLAFIKPSYRWHLELLESAWTKFAQLRPCYRLKMSNRSQYTLVISSRILKEKKSKVFIYFKGNN